MKVLAIFVLIALCAVAYAQKPRITRDGTAAGRAELRRHLFSEYDKINIPDNVRVRFGLTLIGLDVDEDRGTLETDAWTRVAWRDSRLTWDNATNGIDLLRVSPHEVWRPDITLYNSANMKEMMSCWDTNVIVYANGDVLWVPPCHISSYCNLTLDKYPYGEQKCFLKFGSWTYDSDLMDLQLYDDSSKGASVEEFGSTVWKLLENSAQRNEKRYPCCPEPYTDVTYNFTFVRADNSRPRNCEL